MKAFFNTEILTLGLMSVVHFAHAEDAINPTSSTEKPKVESSIWNLMT